MVKYRSEVLLNSRLHDYYKYNISKFVNEGIFETDSFSTESNGDVTIWDAFKIGVKGANKMFLGSGLDIMIMALNKAQQEGVTLPPFIQPMDITVLKNLVGRLKLDTRAVPL